jgi:hypothetical protein
MSCLAAADWRCASCAYSNVAEAECCDLCDHPHWMAVQPSQLSPMTSCARPSQTAHLQELVKEMEQDLRTLADALVRATSCPAAHDYKTTPAIDPAGKPSPSWTEKGMHKRQRVAASHTTPQPSVESRMPRARPSCSEGRRPGSTALPGVAREFIDPDGTRHIEMHPASGFNEIQLKYYARDGIVKCLDKSPPETAYTIYRSDDREWASLLMPQTVAQWHVAFEEFFRSAKTRGCVAKLPRPVI